MAPHVRFAAVRPLLARLPANDPVRGCLVPGAERIPDHVADALWAAVVRREGLGAALAVAGEIAPATYGLLTYLLAACSTVGEALRGLVLHYGLISEAARYRVDGSASTVCVDLDTRSDRAPVVPTFLLAVAVAFVRDQASAPVAVREVSLRIPRPTDPRPLLRFFGAPIRFDAACNRLTYPRHAATVPMRGADPGLFEILEDSALRESTPHPPLASQVRHVLRNRRTVRPPSLDRVAAELGMSARTMRRRLQQLGTSFQALLDDERRRVAETTLLQPQTSIAGVAEALGFTEPAAFRRAFRRWTGVTPHAYVRAMTSVA